MRPLAWPLVGVGVLVACLSGCATGTTVEAAPGDPAGAASVRDAERMRGRLVPEGYDGRYRVSAMVLQEPDGPPGSCFTVAESNPPHCGGVPLVGWDWDVVTSRTFYGTTWTTTDVTVVGTYDGTSLTLTEPAGPDAEPDPLEADTTWDAPAGETVARSEVELARIRDELADEPGLQMAGTGGGTVTLGVTVAWEQRQQELDERYGPGVVVLQGWLEPIDLPDGAEY